MKLDSRLGTWCLCRGRACGRVGGGLLTSTSGPGFRLLFIVIVIVSEFGQIVHCLVHQR